MYREDSIFPPPAVFEIRRRLLVDGADLGITSSCVL